MTQDPQRARGPQVPPSFLVVARVVSPHGVKGEVQCDLVTDFPERFRAGGEVYLGDPPRPHRIQRASISGARVLLGLAGVSDRDGAEALRGALLLVPEAAAVDLPEGEFFWHQVIGLRAETPAGEPLGTVADILQTGANDVYVVRGPDGDMLVPAIKEIVREIDPAQGRMVVQPLPGMAPEPRRERPPRRPRRRPRP